MLANTRFIIIACFCSALALAQSVPVSPAETTVAPVASTRATTQRPAAATTQAVASSAAPAIPSGACLQACLAQSRTPACDPLTDPSCICTDTQFQETVLECVQSNCPEESANAIAQQAQNCPPSAGSSAGRSSASSLSLPATITRSASNSSATASASSPLSRSVSPSSSRNATSPSTTQGLSPSGSAATKATFDLMRGGIAAGVAAICGLIGIGMVL